MNDAENDQEKPVAFYEPTDLFGHSIPPITDIPESKKTENVLPFSEYQSVKHFCILSMVSLGLYPFFWFFKHWQYLRDEKHRDISPSFRTAFTLIFGYSLFQEFEILAKQKGYNNRQPLLLLFLVFIILAFCVVFKGSLLPLFSFFAFIPLIPVLHMMNFYYLKEQAGYPIKKKLSKDEKWFMASIWIFWFAVILCNLMFL